MGLQVALGKAIRPLPVRGRPEPSPDPLGGSATPVWKPCFRKPSPIFCLCFPGHLEHSLLNHLSGPTWAGHAVPTMWGTGLLCPWPDVLGERSVATTVGSGKPKPLSPTEGQARRGVWRRHLGGR